MWAHTQGRANTREWHIRKVGLYMYIGVDSYSRVTYTQSWAFPQGWTILSGGSYSRMDHTQGWALYILRVGLYSWAGSYTRVGSYSGVNHTQGWAHTEGWAHIQGWAQTQGWAHTQEWGIIKGEFMLRGGPCSGVGSQTVSRPSQ